VFEYLARCTGVRCDGFFRKWFSSNGGVAYVYVDRSTDPGSNEAPSRIQGIGAIRACANGFRIGPLFASNAKIARTLLAALSFFPVNDAVSVNRSSAPNAVTSVSLDVPDGNDSAVELVQRMGWNATGGAVRMYHCTDANDRPAALLDTWFGMWNLEVGP